MMMRCSTRRFPSHGQRVRHLGFNTSVTAVPHLIINGPERPTLTGLSQHAMREPPSGAPTWRAAPMQQHMAAQNILVAHEQAMVEQSELFAAEMRQSRQLCAQLEQRIAELEDQLATQEATVPESGTSNSEEKLRAAHQWLRKAVLDKAFVHTPASELACVPLSALAGIGDKSSNALHDLGLDTIADLAAWTAIDRAINSAPDTPAATLCDGSNVESALQALRLKTAADICAFKAIEFAAAVVAIARGA